MIETRPMVIQFLHSIGRFQIFVSIVKKLHERHIFGIAVKCSTFVSTLKMYLSSENVIFERNYYSVTIFLR